MSRGEKWLFVLLTDQNWTRLESNICALCTSNIIWECYYGYKIRSILYILFLFIISGSLWGPLSWPLPSGLFCTFYCCLFSRFYRRFFAFITYYILFIVAFALRPGVDKCPGTVTTNNLSGNGMNNTTNAAADPCFLLKACDTNDKVIIII
jgi:hypothetical protein